MPSEAAGGLVYDVRLSAGGGKSVTVAPGSTVSVDVFAVITGTNGTATDDGFSNGYFSLLSNNAGSPATTVLLSVNSGGGPVAPFASGSQSGAVQLIDSDSDSDVGKKSSDAGTGNFVFARTGTTGGELGTGTGSAEFKIASFVLTASGSGGPASFNLALPGTNGTGATGLSVPILYRQDGNPVNNLTNVSVGAPVIVAVPEPAGLATVALAAGALLRRRRR